MKFKVPVQALRKALSICSLAAGKPPSPLANKVTIKSYGKDDQRVEVMATDNAIQSRFWINSTENDCEDEFTMPIDKLSAMCRESDDGDIEFGIFDGSIEIKSSAGKWSLPRDVVSMSIKKCDMDIESAKIPYDTLSRVLRWVDFVAAGSVAMNVSGVRLEVKDKELIAIATDGKRLSFFRTPCESTDAMSCRVPLAVLKMAELLKDDVEFTVDSSTAYFQSTSGVVCGTELDGRFPNTSAFLAVYDKNDGCSLDPGELASAMRAVGIVTDTEIKKSSIEPVKGRLRMHSTSMFGKSESYCAIEGDNGPRGNFNCRYVEQAASALASLHEGAAKSGMVSGTNGVMYLRGGEFAHIIIGMTETA